MNENWSRVQCMEQKKTLYVHGSCTATVSDDSGNAPSSYSIMSQHDASYRFLKKIQIEYVNPQVNVSSRNKFLSNSIKMFSIVITNRERNACAQNNNTIRQERRKKNRQQQITNKCVSVVLS